MNSDWPRSKDFLEDIFVKFTDLEPNMPAFIKDYPGSVYIPTITAEWKKLMAMGYLDVRSSFEFNLVIHYPQKSRENIGTSSDWFRGR